MATGHLSANQPIKSYSIVLLGKTGSGKSRTGNSILGNPSPIAFQFGTPTDDCTVKTIVDKSGKTIHVIDTPSDISTEPNVKQIEKSMNLYEDNSIPIFIFCIQIGRFNDSDYLAYENYKRYIGDGIFSHALVLFTCYDKWENDMEDSQIENPDFKSYIKSLSDQNKHLLHLCGHRWVAFNNRLKGADNDVQVKNLFEIIDDILKFRTANQKLLKRILGSPKIEEAGTVPWFQKQNQIKEGHIQNNGTTESDPKDNIEKNFNCVLPSNGGSCDEKGLFQLKCNLL